MKRIHRKTQELASRVLVTAAQVKQTQELKYAQWLEWLERERLAWRKVR